jgi:hypothetical protein
MVIITCLCLLQAHCCNNEAFLAEDDEMMGDIMMHDPL